MLECLCDMAVLGERAHFPTLRDMALPGGYKVGEKVFVTWPSQTFPSGDKVVHGQQGEVTGPATSVATKGKGVNVRFPGNTASINCLLTRVRRPSASSAAKQPACALHTHARAPHTRRCPRPERSRDSLCRDAPAVTACAAARAAQPTARVREGWWPRAWCGVAASVARPERRGG
jgi:hypothetical protein